LRLRRTALRHRQGFGLRPAVRPAARRPATERVEGPLRGLRLHVEGELTMSGEAVGRHRPARDWPFLLLLVVVGGTYVRRIVALLVADATFTTPGHLLAALGSKQIRFAVWLSLLSCTITAFLSVLVGVPLGYLLSRWDSIVEPALATLPGEWAWLPRLGLLAT